MADGERKKNRVSGKDKNQEKTGGKPVLGTVEKIKAKDGFR